MSDSASHELLSAGVFTNALALIIVGAALLVPELLASGLLGGAVNGIFQASLYNLTTTGDAGPTIDTDLAREALQAG